jgi:hypothetical protein
MLKPHAPPGLQTLGALTARSAHRGGQRQAPRRCIGRGAAEWSEAEPRTMLDITVAGEDIRRFGSWKFAMA